MVGTKCLDIYDWKCLDIFGLKYKFRYLWLENVQIPVFGT